MFDNGKHIGLSKLDGWRCRTTIYADGTIDFLSSSGKRLPVSEKVRNAVRAIRDAGRVPLASQLDGEWMKRRPDYDGPECIYLFAPMVLAGEWVGHLPFKERWEWINKLELPVDDLSIKKSDHMPNEPLLLPASANCELTEFFDIHINVPRTEGVVIYKAEGKMYGNPREPKKSRDMYKIKYREGHDGRTKIE
ncbi:MAG: hypothetical protein GF411_00980 [Candidatus Lokiarchaeota archaeon]|nr:hypothetical protein [Candidatus Lokiarchaeota archaeon]